MGAYKEEYPEVKVDRDYYPLKVSEEWGECLKSYLMYTNRGRQKGLTKDDIPVEFAEEIVDVFGFLILFAEEEGIDIEESLQKKWFSLLEE